MVWIGSLDVRNTGKWGIWMLRLPMAPPPDTTPDEIHQRIMQAGRDSAPHHGGIAEIQAGAAS